MKGFCVFVLRFSSLFLFEGKLNAHKRGVRGGTSACVCACVLASVAECVFLELRVNLLTGSVSGGGQWRF